MLLWPIDVLIPAVMGITVYVLVLAFSIAILAYMVMEEDFKQ
jgi:hypothetical protein